MVAGYGVRLGQRLDATTVRAWCSISVLPKTAPAVLRALEAMVEVEEVSAVSGPFDYWCSCAARAMNSWMRCSTRWANWTACTRRRPASCSAARSTGAAWEPEYRPTAFTTFLIAVSAFYISARSRFHLIGGIPQTGPFALSLP